MLHNERNKYVAVFRPIQRGGRYRNGLLSPDFGFYLSCVARSGRLDLEREEPPMNLDTITPDLEHIETPTAPQTLVNREYLVFLEAKLRRQRAVLLEAQLCLNLGETRRAYSTLCQALSE